MEWINLGLAICAIIWNIYNTYADRKHKVELAQINSNLTKSQMAKQSSLNLVEYISKDKFEHEKQLYTYLQQYLSDYDDIINIDSSITRSKINQTSTQFESFFGTGNTHSIQDDFDELFLSSIDHLKDFYNRKRSFLPKDVRDSVNALVYDSQIFADAARAKYVKSSNIDLMELIKSIVDKRQKVYDSITERYSKIDIYDNKES